MTIERRSLTVNSKHRPINVLVACEFSGIVRDAFIMAGHNALSCDLLPSDDLQRDMFRKPLGDHYQGDMFDLNLASYDLVIAHPPCTSVCLSGNRHYAGTPSRKAGVEFVRRIWELPIDRLCIENPMGILNSSIANLPRPQIIHPWQFGHGESKATCLWTRGLCDLTPTDIVYGRSLRLTNMPPGPMRWINRSRTYSGIAKAMAIQWGGLTAKMRPKLGTKPYTPGGRL